MIHQNQNIYKQFGDMDIVLERKTKLDITFRWFEEKSSKILFHNDNNYSRFVRSVIYVLYERILLQYGKIILRAAS